MYIIYYQSNCFKRNHTYVAQIMSLRKVFMMLEAEISHEDYIIRNLLAGKMLLRRVVQAICWPLSPEKDC